MNWIVQLMFRFFVVGLLSVGGGYATLPLIRQQVVDNAHWLTLQEFTDIITISQMTPGPLAVNATTFVGMRVGGVGGAIVATLSCIIPGVIIALILQRIFLKSDRPLAATALLALRSASAGLIMAAAATILVLALFDGRSLAVENLNGRALIITGICFGLLRKKRKPNTLVIMAVAGVMGCVILL